MVETTQIVIGVYGFLIVAYASAFLRQKSAKKKAANMRDELDSMASAFNEVHRELSTMNNGIDSVLEEDGPVLAFDTVVEATEDSLDIEESPLTTESLSFVLSIA